MHKLDIIGLAVILILCMTPFIALSLAVETGLLR